MISENGWEVITDQSSPKLKVIRLAKSRIPLRLRKEIAPILAHVAYRVDTEVALLRIKNKPGFQDEGGWNYRKIDGSTKISNHASGTAIDLNWQSWIQFKKAMSTKQRAAAQDIADDLAEVVRWGGNYTPSRLDEMHWEIRPGVSLTEAKKFIKDHDINEDGTIG